MAFYICAAKEICAVARARQQWVSGLVIRSIVVIGKLLVPGVRFQPLIPVGEFPQTFVASLAERDPAPPSNIVCRRTRIIQVFTRELDRELARIEWKTLHLVGG